MKIDFARMKIKPIAVISANYGFRPIERQIRPIAADAAKIQRFPVTGGQDRTEPGARTA